MTDVYLKKFTHLHVDKSSARWAKSTNYYAPHKPLLLLSVIDLIAQGLIQKNLIELNAELIDTFDLYWLKIIGTEKRTTPVLPFFHLQSDSFWYLIPVPGKEQIIKEGIPIRSFTKMRELVLGAKLDDILFNQLQIDESRDNFRRVLIETYFAPEIRPILIEVGVIASESFEYSKELTTQLRGRFKVVRDTPEVEHQYRTEARSTAFRRLVVEAYNHRCAVCKIRLLTPEGHTAISAAHIVPWSESHNDDPRNGMALCGLHHWAFDKGLVGVAPDYRIIVSPIVSIEGNTGEFVLSFADKQIHCPDDQVLFPAKLALKWHQKNVFRAEM